MIDNLWLLGKYSSPEIIKLVLNFKYWIMQCFLFRCHNADIYSAGISDGMVC